jgi:hypothetical protein
LALNRRFWAASSDLVNYFKEEDMSEKVKIRIQTSQKVTYDQIVEMTREQWEALKATPEKLMEDESRSPLSDWLNFNDVLDSDDYDEPNLTVVDDDGKPVRPNDYYCPV